MKEILEEKQVKHLIELGIINEGQDTAFVASNIDMFPNTTFICNFENPDDFDERNQYWYSALSFLDLYNLLPGEINGYYLLITKAAVSKKTMVNYYNHGEYLYLINEFIEEDEPIDALYKLLLVLKEKKYI